jgi:hypothetical protein
MKIFDLSLISQEHWWNIYFLRFLLNPVAPGAKSHDRRVGQICQQESGKLHQKQVRVLTYLDFIDVKIERQVDRCLR